MHELTVHAKNDNNFGTQRSTRCMGAGHSAGLNLKSPHHVQQKSIGWAI